MKLNREWHEANPMPEKPTLDQRFQWHLQHEKMCGCRPMPPRLREQMQAKGRAE